MRLRMKADHLSCQTLYQASAKPHLPLWFRRITLLSSAHSFPDSIETVPALLPRRSGQTRHTLDTSRIMTSVQHLNIDSNFPLLYRLLLLILEGKVMWHDMHDYSHVIRKSHQPWCLVAQQKTGPGEFCSSFSPVALWFYCHHNSTPMILDSVIQWSLSQFFQETKTCPCECAAHTKSCFLMCFV